MNIFAINLTCPRDAALSELMRTTLIKYGQPYISQIRSIITGGRDLPRYGNGAGWQASMMKLSAIDQMLRDYEVQDDDFILSVDSDVVFGGSDLFDVVSAEYGIIGTQHKPPYVTKHGPWGHMSGALIFIRGDVARAMCALTDIDLNAIRYQEFKPFVIVENEDVVLSYLAMVCGAKAMDLPGTLSSGNFEEEVRTKQLRSYYHLNYLPTQFLEVPVTGKWDIPHVLRMKNIEL